MVNRYVNWQQLTNIIFKKDSILIACGKIVGKDLHPKRNCINTSLRSTFQNPISLPSTLVNGCHVTDFHHLCLIVIQCCRIFESILHPNRSNQSRSEYLCRRKALSRSMTLKFLVFLLLQHFSWEIWSRRNDTMNTSYLMSKISPWLVFIARN